jgi:hypothetical protein
MSATYSGAVRWRAGAVALGLVASACSSAAVGGQGAHTVVCAPIFFGVAGSAQGPEHGVPRRRPPGVSAVDGRQYGTTVGLLKTELVRLAGSKLAAAHAVDYPATGRFLDPTGLNPAIAASEAAGARTLASAIRAGRRAPCGARPVLLAGYSQGAEVVAQAVTALRPAEQRHIAVALFGNPSYRPGRPGDYPATGHDAGLRPTFLGTAFTLPPRVRRSTIDICAPGDPVCGVDTTAPTVLAKIVWVLAHAAVHREAYAFGRAGYTERAARFLWQHRTD